MNKFFLLLIGVALLAIASAAGCAGPAQDRPSGIVQGSSLHEKDQREEIWRNVYKEREKDARENLERSPEPDLTDN